MHYFEVYLQFGAPRVWEQVARRPAGERRNSGQGRRSTQRKQAATKSFNRTGWRGNAGFCKLATYILEVECSIMDQIEVKGVHSKRMSGEAACGQWRPLEVACVCVSLLIKWWMKTLQASPSTRPSKCGTTTEWEIASPTLTKTQAGKQRPFLGSKRDMEA